MWWQSESCSPHELACQVQEGLLVVVVALCRDLMVLQILFPADGTHAVRKQSTRAHTSPTVTADLVLEDKMMLDHELP